MIKRKPYEPPVDFDHFCWQMKHFIPKVLDADTPEKEHDCANEMRCLIHDTAQRSTGWVSKKALALKSSERCKEHFKPRLGVGKYFVRKIKSGRFSMKTLRRMYLVFFSACRVHCVHKDENRELAKIQNDEVMKHWHWRKQYKKVGIDELVYIRPIYLVNGIEYWNYTLDDMVKETGLSKYQLAKLRLQEVKCTTTCHYSSIKNRIVKE